MKLVGSSHVRMYGSHNLKRIGRCVLDFIQYLKKYNISLMDALRYPIYREPHFLRDSKEFFMNVRQLNIEKVKSMAKNERMLLF